MHEHFFEAIAHPPAPFFARLRGRSAHVILGFRLRPLSIWHEALLDAIESPFSPGKGLTPASDRETIFGALFQATEICRLLPPNLPSADTWAHRHRRRSAFRKFYRHADKLTLLREQLKFLTYLGDYRPQPIYGRARATSKKDKPETPVSSPHWLYQAALFKRFNPETKFNSIWAMSPGELAWINAASQEANGIPIKIVTEAFMKARQRAIEKGAAKTAEMKSSNSVVAAAVPSGRTE